MPLTLNGSGTVSGISAGGLPDGCIQSADLAAGVGAGKLLKIHYGSTETQVTVTTPSRTDTGLAVTFTPEALGSTFYIQINQFGRNGVSNDQAIFNLYLMRAIAGGTASEIEAYYYLGNYTSNDTSYWGSPLGYKDTPSYSSGQTINYHMEVGFYTGNYNLSYRAQEGSNMGSSIFVYELGA